MSNNPQIKNSVKTLLSKIIDYAGLFPPSKVSMETAVQNYAEYLKSENSWMLGRFITPVNLLDEFSRTAGKVLQKDNGWRLSAIAGEDFSQDLEEIADFNNENADAAVIDTVEVKAQSSEEVKAIAHKLPKNLTVYIEIPSSIILTDLITAIALSKTRAKIRTGGVTQNAFPPVDEIVKFMRVCIAANIPFKATAGLHHPLRGIKPLTYEEDAARGAMNGFLNLFLTAVFLRQNLNHKFVHELMNDENAENFTFEEDGISWKNHTMTIAEIELTRRKCAVSFGSCSFTEPIEDLKTLNILH